MTVKHGSTRTVILIYLWAIKIPSFVEWRLFLLGLLANMQERKFWGTRWPELCPVVFSLPGGWLVIMKRARPMTLDQFLRMDLAGWCERPDYTVPAELKIDSFGWLNGRLVAVDYGN